MFRYSVFALLFVLPLGAAEAVTINISSQSGASAFNVPRQTDLVVIDDVETVGGPTNYSASTAASVLGATASSSGSADIDTGLLRSRTEVDISPVPGSGGHDAGGATEASMDIGFTASGSGNVSFQLSVDGFWDLEVGSGALNWQAQAKMSLFDLGGTRLRATDEFRLNQNLNPSVGVFSDTLAFDFFVSDGAEYSIFTSLLTQIINGLGVVDFANTAALSVFTDPLVQLTFDDPRVLTVSSGPAPIPLPAAFWRLVAALASLAALRRRRVKELTA